MRQRNVWPLHHQSGSVPAPQHPMTKGRLCSPLEPIDQPYADWIRTIVFVRWITKVCNHASEAAGSSARGNHKATGGSPFAPIASSIVAAGGESAIEALGAATGRPAFWSGSFFRPKLNPFDWVKQRMYSVSWQVEH